MTEMQCGEVQSHKNTKGTVERACGHMKSDRKLHSGILKMGERVVLVRGQCPRQRNS